MKLPFVVGDRPTQENFEALAAVFHWGDGNPNGRVLAAAPAIYIREDPMTGAAMYVKTGTGNTGWIAVA